MLDVLAAPALAEEDDAPEAMTPAEPEYYPALVPEATRVISISDCRTLSSATASERA